MKPSPWAWTFLWLSSLLAVGCQERLFNNPHDPDADTRRYELLATFDLPGIVPVDLAFSGDALWVCDSAGRIIAVNVNSGQLIRELTVAQPASGIAYDGRYLWMSVRDTANLQLVSIITSAVLRDIRLTRGNLAGLDWFGGRIYAADRLGNGVLVLDDETGLIEQVVPHPGFSLDGVACDGGSVWTADGQQAILYRIAPTAAIAAYPGPDRSPAGMCAAAGFIWLGDRSGRVYKLRFP